MRDIKKVSFSSRTNDSYYNAEIDTNNNENIIKKGEAKQDIEDVVAKVKAGGTAVAKKVFDTDKDLETEYQNAKRTENKAQSDTKVKRSAKELITANIPRYKKILVPHDGSEVSDKALAHAIYLSKLSKAEIFILNAVEDLHEIAPTTISASPKPTEKGTSYNEVELADNEASFTSTVSETSNTKAQTTVSDKDLDVAIKGRLIDMIQERITLCKEAGVESNVSYKIQTGKTSDSIVNLTKEVKADLIIMVSEKLGSPIKGIMSNTRKVIDAVEIPVVVLSR